MQTEQEIRVLYIALVNYYSKSGESDGVVRKVRDQLYALTQNGYHSFVIAYGDNCIIGEDIITGQKAELSCERNRYRMLELAVVYAKNMKCNYIYIRYPYCDPFFLRMLKRFKSMGSRIYVEFPAYPTERISIKYGLSNFLLSRLDIIFAWQMRKYIYEFRIMGETRDTLYGKKCKNIQNGIRVNQIKCKEANAIKDNNLVMICISRMNDYHGYDRIIKGIHNYYLENNHPMDVMLYMIGNGRKYNEWKSMTSEYDLQERIIFTGDLTTANSDAYFETANIAVGSLGLHRVGLKKISTLKSREYISRGLPVLYSHTEIGVQSDFRFILKVAPNDEPINIRDIIHYYENVIRTNPNSVQEIRKYAEEHFDWMEVMNLK